MSTSWKQKIAEAPRFSGTGIEIVKVLDKKDRHVAWKIFTKKGKIRSEKIYPKNTDLYQFGDTSEFVPSYEPVYATETELTHIKEINAKKNAEKKPKVDLKVVASEFEIISDNIHLFYNKKTGEFDSYLDFDDGMDDKDNSAEKFKNAVWVACPSQWDIDEYSIMADFAETVSDSHKSELLCIALRGSGAFRRFKDTAHCLGLIDEWYEFKQKTFMKIAKDWCDKHKIKYDDKTGH